MSAHGILRLKALPIILAVLAACGTARADSLSGVVVGEDGAPIAGAALTLTQGKASRQGATDGAGAFRFGDCQQGAAAALTVAKAGYETLKYELTAISGDVSLDTIVMARTSVKLGEAKVVARTTTIEGNRRIIYLTKKQRERYADGASLLNTLKLPSLTVIPASKEVHYWGKGELKYYINDFPADIAKVRALLPKDIVRVECYDHPGPEFGVGTGLVLRFITKRYERGASVVATLDKALNRNLGDYSVESRISHKNSEFALSYNGGYDNSNHHQNQFQTAVSFPEKS